MCLGNIQYIPCGGLPETTMTGTACMYLLYMYHYEMSRNHKTPLLNGKGCWLRSTIHGLDVLGERAYRPLGFLGYERSQKNYFEQPNCKKHLKLIGRSEAPKLPFSPLGFFELFRGTVTSDSEATPPNLLHSAIAQSKTFSSQTASNSPLVKQNTTLHTFLSMDK